LLGEMRKFGGQPPPVVIHSFSGPRDYAESMLELGAAISFSGLVFRSGEEVSAEVVRIVPDDRILVETDSPFLSPPGAPRARNEPEWVRLTAEWIVEQRDADEDALGDTLVANYDRIFGRARG
jgi:TatD DNase family protein